MTRPSVNGLQMADLHLSRLDGVNITRVFRSGLQLFPYHNLTLQLGDRVYCVGPENSVKRLAERLGDEEQKLNHPNMLSLFIGIALGILVGSLPITFPGMPVPVKLGVAGGPLVIAILLGSWGPRLPPDHLYDAVREPDAAGVRDGVFPREHRARGWGRFC